MPTNEHVALGESISVTVSGEQPKAQNLVVKFAEAVALKIEQNKAKAKL
jgi:hypothetical protein